MQPTRWTPLPTQAAAGYSVAYNFATKGVALSLNIRATNRFHGATLRARTGDLLITNQPLYQLS